MRILAVDDEERALRVLCGAIREAEPKGELSFFSKAGEALQWLEENPPDVAFLDIRMPEMSGMELARSVKRANPMANVIFVTAYDSYVLDAIRMHASGYLLKPVLAGDVRRELDNLLYPKQTEEPHIFARCFGSFDLFVDGKPMTFRLAKARELLAILIDRRGATVSRRELTVQLFEDESYSLQSQDYFGKAYRSLKASLEEAGIGELLCKEHGNYFVNLRILSCDAIDYENGLPSAINRFHGEYMNQYSWAEESMGRFMKI